MAKVIMLSLNSFCILILVVAVLTTMKNVTGAPEEDWSEGRLDYIYERGPFVGGDMILTSEQFQGLNEAISGQYSGIRDPTVRWSKGIIPYRLDLAFNSSDQSIIQNGMDLIQGSTVIRFIPRTSEPSYVYIRKGGAASGCYANIGRKKNGVNIVNLGRGCVHKGVVAHELIHTIGFYHEQARTDRDNYVTVLWNNIEQGQKHNFYKWGKNYVNDFGIPYDYQSIMHYSQYAFAKDPKEPTILARKENPLDFKLGQYDRLTEYDSKKINAMYAHLVSGSTDNDE